MVVGIGGENLHSKLPLVGAADEHKRDRLGCFFCESSRNRVGDSGGGWLTNLVHCVGILHYGWAWIWHASPMAGKRRRRLWDTYCFPGFRPEQTVCGIFGDPKSRVITLKRRSKKRLVGVAGASRWGGTTARCAVCAIFRAATLGYFWNWRCGAWRAAV